MSTRIAMLMRKTPYGTVYPAEGFRAMMGLAVFELNLCVIFLDDGVYTLLKDQCPAAMDMKALGKGFAGLGDVGITEFYVHDTSLAERGINPADLVMDAQVVDGRKIAEVLAGCSAVLPF